MNLSKPFESNIWQRCWQLWQSKGIKTVIATTWSYFWLRFAGLGYWGRITTWLATWLAPPYKTRRSFARYHKAGYIAPSANIAHSDLQIGVNIFVGDRVTIFEDCQGGSVELSDRVYLHNDICIQTSAGGSLTIGLDTHIQPRCQFFAYHAPIQIGSGVQIGTNCAFHLNNRNTVDDQIEDLLLLTKQGIVVDDDVWIGHGAIVLSGTRIGKGAVIGSGAVVDRDIPDGAIIVGVPARVIGTRSKSVPKIV